MLKRLRREKPGRQPCQVKHCLEKTVQYDCLTPFHAGGEWKKMVAVKFLNKRSCSSAQMFKVTLLGVEYRKLCDVYLFI